jgi:hypothetical protein
LEDSDPQGSDSHCSNPGNRAAEGKKHKHGENSIVNRKNVGGLDKSSVDGIEKIDMSEHISTEVLADRVLCFVNCCQKHRHPCN